MQTLRALLTAGNSTFLFSAFPAHSSSFPSVLFKENGFMNGESDIYN